MDITPHSTNSNRVVIGASFLVFLGLFMIARGGVSSGFVPNQTSENFSKNTLALSEGDDCNDDSECQDPLACGGVQCAKQCVCRGNKGVTTCQRRLAIVCPETPTPTPDYPTQDPCDNAKDDDDDGKCDFGGTSMGYAKEAGGCKPAGGGPRVNMPADPSCDGDPSGITESSSQNWWVELDITVSPPAANNAQWKLSCPGGPYSCNGGTGIGPTYLDGSNCSSNGPCAGAGSYSISEDNDPNWDCVGNFKNRGAPPPVIETLTLHLNCVPQGSPLPSAISVDVNAPAFAAPGATIPVDWQYTSGTPTVLDWLGFLPYTAPPALPPTWPTRTVPNVWVYWTGVKVPKPVVVAPDVGSLQLVTPATPGTYQIVYYQKDSVADVDLVGRSSVITLGASGNNPPTASAVTVTEPNYCQAGPSASIAWTYSDPEGDAQQSFQVQVDDDPAFGSPVVNQKVISAAKNYFANNLAFNTTYSARVRVTDAQGNTSAWTTMSQCVGAGCLPAKTSWKTPAHRYPVANFSYSPPNPAVGQKVTFDSQTPPTNSICYDGGNNPTPCKVWDWTFLGGTPSKVIGNFPVTDSFFYTVGGNVALLAVTDAQGYSCSAVPVNLNIQRPVPTWKETVPQ